MGIKGLQTFLNPYEAELFGPPQSLASQLDGKILLVDFAALIFFLIEQSSPVGPDGLSYITGTTPRIVNQLTAFTNRLAGEGIRQVWVLDGGYNQSKYETAVSRTQQRTPAVCHFTGRILEGCLVDESGPLPYASFQEFAQKYLIPSLALPKYGRNQVTRYHMFRDTMEDWSVHGLVRQLIEEGSLLGFETTILEGDARIARIANVEMWRGQPVGAVLSQDSDFLIYGCSYVPFSLLKIDLNPLPEGLAAATTAGMCRRGAFGARLRAISLAHVSSMLQRCAGVSNQAAQQASDLLGQKCPLERFIAMLADVATLSGNDYYSTEAICGDVFLSSRYLSVKLLALLGHNLDRKLLPKCKIALYSIPDVRSSAPTGMKYTNFGAIGAFLIVCAACQLDRPHPVGGLDTSSEAVRSLLFAKGTAPEIEASRYDSARGMYGMSSPMALNEVPPALLTSPYGQLYKDLKISCHFAQLLCGPKRWSNMTHLYRFKQFSMPAANVAAQVRLRSEIAVLGAWTNTSTLDWVTAVQTGEFLKDSLIPGSTMVVTEWNVVEATDSKSGNVRYMLKEDCRPLLDLVHPEPPPTPSTDVLCETIAAVSLVNNSTALFPCSDGCCDVKIDWSSQKARLQWLSKRGESLLSALPKNRCLLYQCLDSAVAAHIPLPPDLTTKLSELTAAMQLEFRCFIDLIFLTERVLIQAYGDFNGGMLAKTCRLYEPLRIARRGYVRGAIEAFFSPSSACNMDSTDWFVSHFSNSSEMAIRCCVFAVHMLFHTTLEHILSLNDSLGAPLSLGVTAAHVFRLCDAMYFTKTASDEIDVLEPIATSSTAVGDSAVAFLMSLQLLT